MTRLLRALLCLFSVSAWATELEIIDVGSPVAGDEAYVIFGSDGLVYETASEEVAKQALAAKESGVKVEVELLETSAADDILGLRNIIDSISLTSNEVESRASFGSLRKDYNAKGLMSSYVSDFDSVSEVASLMRTMRTDTRSKSQCYNRAHIWSWELHSRRHEGRRVQTGKIWIFFTKKYIREYKYKWWFHIAPYLNVNGEARVIDKEFSYSPQRENEWTDMFMQNNAECTQVTRYSSYSSNPYDGYCYTMKTSVFYWQPFQIENLENKGEVRDQWNSWELKKAYRNGIGWFSKVPELR